MNDPSSTVRGYKAAENIYHRFLTGLILRTVVMRGSDAAAALVFRLFRRQQQKTLLPGIEKLGLGHLPDAVKCAQYHYLSNQIGDVNVEYMYESDTKAWVRYPPPRWIWDGTAICGIPSEVSRQMMYGWHAHNGVSLGNPRLGFVCTKQTVDGQPGLEGYFMEYDRELAPDGRLRFAPGEESPPFDPARAPKLDTATWPEERVRKALRNYAMEYVRNVIPEAIALFGPEEAANLGRTTARLIGLQYYRETAALLSVEDDTPGAFARLMEGLGRGQGDDTAVFDDAGMLAVRQTTWNLMRGQRGLHPAAFEIWNGLWEGLLASHNRRLRLTVASRMDRGDARWEWRIA